MNDQKAIVSAVKTNRGNISYQSRFLRRVNWLLHFEFEVNHFAGSKLGVVDFLSQHSSSEAPKPSKLDEQFNIKPIKKLFQACDNIGKMVQLEKSHPSSEKDTSATAYISPASYPNSTPTVSDTRLASLACKLKLLAK